MAKQKNNRCLNLGSLLTYQIQDIGDIVTKRFPHRPDWKLARDIVNVKFIPLAESIKRDCGVDIRSGVKRMERATMNKNVKEFFKAWDEISSLR